MAGPSKRPRADDDVDGDDEIEIESASSSFRQRENKRTKVAMARATGGLIPSDDDVDDGYANGFLEDGDSFDNGNNGDGHDDTEVDEDPDVADTMMHLDDDSDGEEVNELIATQIVGKEMTRTRRNVVQEEGIIQEIFCRNFMCHSKLRISLGPNINFIIGHNGSGKSAVLTALTMCLGAKASQTNRGASLKSLIKEGQDSATLGVKIKNEGENAYKPDLYGRSIIVERHFTKGGTSGFKLKSEHEKIISSKRADLDDILDYFGLQLDNPINVLTQDMARQFLSTSTASDKYKFFLRGTMLEALDADYKVLELHLDSIESNLALRKNDLVVLQQKHKDAEDRKNRSQHLNTLQQMSNRLRRQFAWCQVEGEERILAAMESDVERAQANVDAAQETATSVDAMFEAAESKVQASNRAVEAQQKLLGPAQATWNAAKTELDANKDKLAEYIAEERQMKDSRKTAISSIKKLQQDIAAEEELLAGQGGEAHARRQAELEELKTALSEAREAYSQHVDRLPGLENAKNVTESRLQKEVEPVIAEASTALQTAQGSLNALQRDENEKYGAFLPNMERLCREIDRETRWRSKPVGPFGLHIQLQKPEWSSVLETTFGGVLNAFAVTCKDDADIFNTISKRVRCNAGVYIGSAQPLDTTGKEPSADIDTILRVLTIKSDIVRNQLIINQAIEQTALVPDGDEANRFMFNNPNGRPDKVKSTFSLLKNGHRSVAGHRLSATRSGAERSDPVNIWPRQPRMQTDRSHQIQAAQDRVNRAKQSHDDAQRRRNVARDELKKAQQAVELHKREERRLKSKVQEAEVAVEDKEAEIDQNRPRDGKLQELQNQLVEAQNEKTSAEQHLSDLYEQKAVYDDKAQPLLTAANEAKSNVELIEARISKAEETVSLAAGERHQILLEKNDKYAAVDDAKELVKKFKEKVVKQKETVETFTRLAMTISPRVAVDEGETPQSLDKKAEALKAQYEKEKRKLGASEEELTAVWAETRKEWKDAEKQWNKLNKLAKLLKRSLQERTYRWMKFREYISARARIQFGYLLQERQFRGRVLLDHEGKKLDIRVEPDMAKASDAGREARTLSGGEKSFSTICLLLSIWEAMGSPIRCLDEFDVFMDSVNRTQSMTLMIGAARRSAGRQFILITPQAMNNVDVADDVKIHKMSDPERGQTTLAFNGQEV